MNINDLPKGLEEFDRGEKPFYTELLADLIEMNPRPRCVPSDWMAAGTGIPPVMYDRRLTIDLRYTLKYGQFEYSADTTNRFCELVHLRTMEAVEALKQQFIMYYSDTFTVFPTELQVMTMEDTPINDANSATKYISGRQTIEKDDEHDLPKRYMELDSYRIDPIKEFVNFYDDLFIEQTIRIPRETGRYIW